VSQPSFDYRDLVIKDGKLIGDWDSLYKKVEDPWHQSRIDHVHDTRRQTAILLCRKIRETYGSIKVLELGCGFGHISKQLTDLNFLTLGTNISSEAIKKASEKNPESVFKSAKFNDFELIYDFNPDIILMAELTWYVLAELDNFLLELNKYAKTRKTPTFLIHLLATYAPGVQKYGREKFTTHQEILKYFNLNYLESGFVETVRPDDPDSQGSYFLAKL
jgi:SAM-dependent methyltransferase